MKHLQYSGKSLLIDDRTADLLVEYAGLLPALNRGDSITVIAIGPDGNRLEASMVLNAATELITESTNSGMLEPDNEVVRRYLEREVELIRRPPTPQPEEGDRSRGYDDDFMA